MISGGIVRRAGFWSGAQTLRLPLAQLSPSVTPHEVFGSDSGLLVPTEMMRDRDDAVPVVIAVTGLKIEAGLPLSEK